MVNRVFSGSPWEKEVGYCRVLQAGNTYYVSGTVAVDENGNPFKPGDAYAQAKRCLEIIQANLEKMNVSLNHVVRTRMFVTDISRWQEFGKAHGEFFGANPPTTSMIEIKQLIAPDYLIEIEAEAYKT